ncbi:MAG: ORF6N domain-containing protein [Candidatus Wallbacteria bacterium]|nr:ORF6N domain-containing protein [Candidatus Wallbacteria bacterium]
MAKRKKDAVPHLVIDGKIFVIRGKRVMLDRDLAELYGVETRTLNQAVKRNLKRFPGDFMFRLQDNEIESLISQIVIPNRGGTRFSPFAFTENGIAMLSTVLNSERAILVNIEIMRTFTKLREILATNKEVREKLEQLEARVDSHDKSISTIIDAIRRLLEQPPEPEQRKIGFRAQARKAG